MDRCFYPALVLVLCLSACANLDKKSAQELAVISAERIWSSDNRFNVEGKFSIEHGEASAPAAAVPESDAAARSFDESEEVRMRNSMLAGKDAYGLFALYAKIGEDYPVLKQYAQSAKMEYGVAVDLPSEKLEIVPVFAVESPHERHYIRMPVLLDAKNALINIEPPLLLTAATGRILGKDLQKRLAQGEPLSIDLKSSRNGQKFPVRHIAHAAVKTAVESVKDMPADSFRIMPMDDFGKMHQARYRVRQEYRPEQERQVSEAMLRRFQENLNRLAQTPEEGVTPQDYEKVKEAAGTLFKIAALEEQRKISGLKHNLPTYSDIYLDAKGRLKASVISADLASDGQKTFRAVMRSRYYNYGNPVFVSRPASGQTVSLKELEAAIDRQ